MFLQEASFYLLDKFFILNYNVITISSIHYKLQIKYLPVIPKRRDNIAGRQIYKLDPSAPFHYARDDNIHYV